jgi:hypothetical protein
MARDPPRIAGVWQRTLPEANYWQQARAVDSDILAVRGRWWLQDQVLATLRGQLADIILGAVFLFIGLAACGIAAIRHRSGVRVLIWFGMWSAMYGALELTESPAAVAAAPHWLQIMLPYLDVSFQYFIVVVAWFAFLELSRGKIRFHIWALNSLGLATAVAAITFFLFTGSADRLMPYSHTLAASSLFLLLTVVAVPKLSSKFFDLPKRGVLTVGMLLFGMEALYVNLTRPVLSKNSICLRVRQLAIKVWCTEKSTAGC